MSVEVVCPKCSSRLKLGEQFLGRKLVCPKCRHLFHASAAAPVQAEVVEAQVVEVEPEAIFAQVVAQEPPRPKRTAQPPQVVTAEVVEGDAEEQLPGPRPKRKRKRFGERPQKSGRPAWVLPLAIGVGLIVPALVVVILVVSLRNSEVNLEKYGTALLILVPINAAILFASLFTVSVMFAGVSIGSVPVFIAKGFFLLLIIVPIHLLPAGQYIAMPFWYIGLMALFGMDMWEALMTTLINWFVGLILMFTIVGGLLESAVQKVAEMPDEDESKLAAPWGLGDIQRLGGHIIRNEVGGGPAIRYISLKGKDIKDEDIVKLRHLPVMELDLSETPITDEGLMELRRNKSLRIVDVSGTKVTAEGIKKLQLKLEGEGRDMGIKGP